MRNKIVVIMLIGISLLIVSCSASWNSASSTPMQNTSSVKPVGKKITVSVDSRHLLNVEIPKVGHLSGPSGAFAGTGSITIEPEKVSIVGSNLFQVSGTGIDVVFDRTTLRQPLTLAFDVTGKPHANDIPLVAHQSDDGQWNFLPATLDSSGRVTVKTSSFSLNIPGWGNVDAFFHALGNFIASGVGGRTSPLTCSGGPSWFHLDPQHSNYVHECVKTNTYKGQQVAEVQLKSNRGVSLQVNLPPNAVPSYVWVEGQTWQERQRVGNWLHFDPNQIVILGAGKTMTVGYTRSAGAEGSFTVSGNTILAVIDTLTGDIFDALMNHEIDALPDSNSIYIAMLYTEAKCITGFKANSLTGGISTADVRSYLSCMTSSAVSGLSKDQTALNIAEQFGGSKLDAAELVKLGKGLEIVGLIVALWPYFQVGWGNVIDKINEWISNGQSTLVSWYIDPPAPTNSSSNSTSTNSTTSTGDGSPTTSNPTGSGSPTSSNPMGSGSPTTSNLTVTLAQGPVVSGGEYRYAVTLSGFPANATVSVECYDSVSPSGFYNFTLSTDASGNAFTQSQCYSGDGPDHWVIANGVTSNHVEWGGTASSPPPSGSGTFSETVGGDANTWTDYSNAGGAQGATIPAYQTVQISCKVTGFKVADGNTWWYRIASAPWSNAYYVSADAFYNNGATSGSLHGTPPVDPKVPNC